MWREHPELHARVATAWVSIRRRLLLTGSRRWRLVSGPSGATIATLMDIGWAPHSPMQWESAVATWTIPSHADGAYDHFHTDFTDILMDIEDTI
eukprot:1494270-Pyramimonas_sp.AAC.1